MHPLADTPFEQRPLGVHAPSGAVGLRIDRAALVHARAAAVAVHAAGAHVYEALEAADGAIRVCYHASR